jgi:hypothetical protein
VSKIINNRICANAIEVRPDTSITTAVEPGGSVYWYYFVGEAGKAYEISDCNGASFDTKLSYGSSCGDLTTQDDGGGCDVQERIVVAGDGNPLYFGWQAYSSGNGGDITWSLSEVATDNRVCSYADAIKLDSAITTPPNEYRWYKFAATAGETYEVDGSQMYGDLYVYSSCGGNQITYGSKTGVLFTASATQDYYIRVYGYSTTYRWSVSLVTDNRACAYADAIKPDSAIITAAQNEYRWYKLAVVAGETYEVDGSGMSGYFDVYSSCSGSEIACNSGKFTFTFTATVTQDYYIRVYGYNTINRWSVSQITDNRVCAYAYAIKPDSAILTSPQSEYRWYKLAVAAGETYEVDGSGMSGSFYVYSSCGGSEITGSSGTFTFTATVTQDYYIRVYGNNAINRWSVSQITDNRVCAYADAIKPDSAILTPQYEYRWYRLAATAGETYAVDGSQADGYFYVYSSCGGNQITGGSGKFTFTATATQNYYIRVYGYNAVNCWSVSQVGDNRICANAEEITLGAAVSTPQNEYRWYKLAATEGKSYGVDGYGINGYFYVYPSCDAYAITSGSGVVTFTASATQDYYISAYGYDALNSWSVSEIAANDNRLCSNATPVSLNTKVPVSHTGRWYSAAVQAGKWYSVSVSSPSSSVAVYIGCEGSVLASGGGTTYFRAAGNATASIRYANQYSATVTDTLIIREGLYSDAPNSTCAAAQSIAAGQPVAVTPVVPGGQSYYAVPTGYYKLAVEAGKSYEIPVVSNSYNIRLSILTACSGSSVADGYLSSGVAFAAQASGEYVITVSGNYSSSSYAPVEWQVNEVSAPLSCAVAEAVAADVTVHTQGVASGAALWYRFTPASGKSYRITSTSGYDVRVYDGCNGSELGYAYGDTLTFVAPSGEDCYIRWAPYKIGYRYEFDWRIGEYTPPAAANTSCATAEQAPLYETISAMLTAGQGRWYALEVTEGRYYSISKSSGGMSIALYTDCQSATPAVTDEGEEEVDTLVYRAGQTGTAYIKVTGSGYKAFYASEATAGAICEAATPVAVDESVLSEEAYTYRWYSLEAEPGYLYTVSNAFSSSYNVEVYDGCGGQQLGYSDGSPITFSVSSDKTCYIRYYNQSGSPQEWSVSRSPVEDNTVCSTAKAAPLNTATITEVEAGKTHWYVFLGEAGKVYEISNCGGASFDTKLSYGSSCESLSTKDGGCNGYMQERLIVQGEGKHVYFGWSEYFSGSGGGSVTWTLTETSADNRLCAYASPVSAGDTVRSTVSYGGERWYKFTAQAGKAYEIAATGNSSSYTAQLSLRSGTCDSIVTLAAVTGSSPLLFQPEQTAAYYIVCRGSTAGSTNDYDWSWQVREVTENKVCANATPVAENAQAGNTHVDGSPLWHAFTAPAAGQYDITASAGQQLKVWTGCESDAPVATGVGSATFTASAGDTYYIEWVASESYEYSYTWSIGQHASAALTALWALNYPLSPAFAPQTEAYHVNVPNDVASVTIAAGAPSGATVEGTGEKSVSVGDTAFTVTVSIGSSSKSYTVLVHRAAAAADNDATLSALAVSAGSLTPSFSAGESSYAVSVESTVSSITITATANHAAAAVSGAGTYSLNTGSGNVFSITVIAEDGTQRNYTLTVTRAAPEVVETPEVLTVTVSPSAVSIEAGGTQQFTANVAVAGGAAQTVTWSVAGKTSESTVINSNGRLAVGRDETAATLTVTATSTVNTAKWGAATVTVNVPDPAVLGVAVSPNPVTVQTGTTQQLNATVEVTGGAAQTVTWRLSGNSSTGTAISAAGLLTVAADETATTLTVTATSTADPTKHSTATVTVTTEAVAPTVTSVSVTLAKSSMQKGETQQLSATVEVTGGAAQTVAWSLSGNSSASTTISADGLLTVAADEASTTLTIRATSTVDETKFGVANVSVTDQPVSEVRSVTVSPTPAIVAKGTTQKFTAVVDATGSDMEAVTWSVSGNNSTGTAIASTAIASTSVLTVAADETATTLTVTATAVFDPTKQGTAMVTVVAATTGIDDQLTAAITLYPNPFTSTLHLSGAEGCTLRVINAAGATVHLRQLASPSETVNLESLPAGVYFLHLETDGKSKTLQAVKQ